LNNSPIVWEEEARQLEKELQYRQIKVQNGPDIIWWGKTRDDNFTIQESYKLERGMPPKDKKEICSKIWNPKIWPKNITFLWLLTHRTNLTMDKLLR